ncbi:MAG: hypothetical protein P4M11_15215 [Candidatus Pacebacteria bacterium]|nr:hypothetical protein [Candidatus Paceibacterota bacterium]
MELSEYLHGSFVAIFRVVFIMTAGLVLVRFKASSWEKISRR